MSTLGKKVNPITNSDLYSRWGRGRGASLRAGPTISCLPRRGTSSRIEEEAVQAPRRTGTS